MTPSQTGYLCGGRIYSPRELSPIREEEPPLRIRIVNSEIAKLNALVNAATYYESPDAAEAYTRMRNALMRLVREMRREVT
jgi:hypothetical protein